MTRDEVIAEIQRGTGFRDNLQTTIIAAMDSAQRQFELGKTLPWFLITYDTPIVHTADAGAITLPTDFIRLHDEYDPYYIEDGSTNVRIPVPRKNYTEGRTTYGNEDNPSDATRPQVFEIRSPTRFMFYPIPNETFTFYLTYYAKQPLPSTLAGSGTNEWMTQASEMFVGETGLRVATIVRDKEAIPMFAARQQAGQKALMGEIIEQELAGRPLIMGRNN